MPAAAPAPARAHARLHALPQGVAGGGMWVWGWVAGRARRPGTRKPPARRGGSGRRLLHNGKRALLAVRCRPAGGAEIAGRAPHRPRPPARRVSAPRPTAPTSTSTWRPTRRSARRSCAATARRGPTAPTSTTRCEWSRTRSGWTSSSGSGSNGSASGGSRAAAPLAAAAAPAQRFALAEAVGGGGAGGGVALSLARGGVRSRGSSWGGRLEPGRPLGLLSLLA